MRLHLVSSELEEMIKKYNESQKQVEIQNDLITKKKLTSGLNNGKTQNYYLFQEKVKTKIDGECKQLDRYGYCASIYDNDEKIFLFDNIDKEYKIFTPFFNYHIKNSNIKIYPSPRIDQKEKFQIQHSNFILIQEFNIIKNLTQ